MLIPLWAFITLQSIAGLLALLAITLIARAWLRRKDLQTRRCYRCHYDLSATNGLKCPECGRVAKSESELLGKRRRWRSTRRGALTLVGASLVCFAGFFAAWPVRYSPTWVLLWSGEWKNASQSKLGLAASNAIWNERVLSRAQIAYIAQATIRGLRAEPPEDWASGEIVMLSFQRIDPTTKETYPLSRVNREAAAARGREREIAERWYGLPGATQLLTDHMRCDLLEAALEADLRHPRFGVPRVSRVDFTNIGSVQREWIMHRFFAPTSEWAVLVEGLHTAFRSEPEITTAAMRSLDHGEDHIHKRIAALLATFDDTTRRVLPQETSERVAVHVQSLRVNGLDVQRVRDELIREEVLKLEGPDEEQVMRACMALRFVARHREAWTASAALTNLATNAGQAQTRQAASVALDAILKQQSYSGEGLRGNSPISPPPSSAR